MPQDSSRSEDEANFNHPETNERIVTLNLNFLEFAILAGCLEVAMQPFNRKVADGLELEGMEKPMLGMITSLDNLVHEQAKLSTDHLGVDRVSRDLARYTVVNENFAATYTKVLQENFIELLKRSKK